MADRHRTIAHGCAGTDRHGARYVPRLTEAAPSRSLPMDARRISALLRRLAPLRERAARARLAPLQGPSAHKGALPSNGAVNRGLDKASAPRYRGTARSGTVGELIANRPRRRRGRLIEKISQVITCIR